MRTPIIWAALGLWLAGGMSAVGEPSVGTRLSRQEKAFKRAGKQAPRGRIKQRKLGTVGQYRGADADGWVTDHGGGGQRKKRETRFGMAGDEPLFSIERWQHSMPGAQPTTGSYERIYQNTSFDDGGIERQEQHNQLRKHGYFSQTKTFKDGKLQALHRHYASSGRAFDRYDSHELDGLQTQREFKKRMSNAVTLLLIANSNGRQYQFTSHDGRMLTVNFRPGQAPTISHNLNLISSAYHSAFAAELPDVLDKLAQGRPAAEAAVLQTFATELRQAERTI